MDEEKREEKEVKEEVKEGEEKLKVVIPAKYKRYFSWGAALLVLLVIVWGIWSLWSRRGTVAKVGKERIKREELDQRLENIYGKDTLDRMIEERLVKQEGVKERVKISKSEVKEKVDELIARFPSQDKFEELLAQSNMALRDVREQVTVGLILEKLVAKEMSEKELRGYFEQNKESFAQPEQVGCRRIVVKSEAEAKDILKELEKGADFAQLAKEKSTDVQTKERGGDLGFLSREQMERGELGKEFAESAFSLKVGELSRIIKTPLGDYQIIKVGGRIPRQPATFENSRERIKGMLIAQRTQGYLEELKDKAKIKTFLEGKKKEKRPKEEE